MRLDPAEIDAIADALAPKVAEILERRFSERPEWAMSIPEAASWAKVEPHVVRDAIAAGRLACIRIGRSVRIRQSDLFAVNGATPTTRPGNGPKVKPRDERKEPAGEVTDADLKAFWTCWKSWRKRIGASYSQAAAYEWVAKQFGGKVEFNIFGAVAWDGASFEMCKQQLAEEENATG